MNASRIEVCYRFARGQAVLIALLGLLGLAGWFLHVPVLKGAAFDVTIKTNASLALVVAGMCLWLAARQCHTRGQMLGLRLLGFVVLLIGSLTLTEHATGVDLHIDQLFASEPPGEPGTASPNRMGPIASTSFTIAGLLFLFWNELRRRSSAFIGLGALVILIIVLLPLIGYIYSHTALYETHILGVSLPMVVGLLLLGSGIALAQPEGGAIGRLCENGLAGDLLRRLVPAAILLPLVVGWLRLHVERYGLIDTSTGVALLVIVLICVYTGMLFFVAGILRKGEFHRAQLLESEREARTTAEELARSKEEFLAIVSHELRAPLQSVLGCVELLRNAGLTADELASVTSLIERSAKSQVRLVKDLVDMSRLRAGKLTLEVQPVNVPAVITSAMETVRPAADEKAVQLDVVIDSPVEPVLGDPQRLQQVLLNLLSNAIKFTPEGGKVQVRLHRTEAQIELTISDTGQGIHPQFLPHVFDLYRQAHNSTVRRGNGLGLGLGIARRLVELHGGSIRAESEGEGRGAAFIVNLPVPTSGEMPPDQRLLPGSDPHGDRNGDPLASNRPTREQAVSSFPPLDLMDVAGIKVLVVDDDRDTRTLLQRLLTEFRCQVVAVDSGVEGLRVLQEFHPDVIISDISMPEQDGYEFIRQVRRLPANGSGQTPAAAVTAFSRPQDRTKALLAGFQEHLTKPVEAVALLAVVARLSGRTSPS